MANMKENESRQKKSSTLPAEVREDEQYGCGGQKARPERPRPSRLKETPHGGERK